MKPANASNEEWKALLQRAEPILRDVGGLFKKGEFRNREVHWLLSQIQSVLGHRAFDIEGMERFFEPENFFPKVLSEAEKLAEEKDLRSFYQNGLRFMSLSEEEQEKEMQ